MDNDTPFDTPGVIGGVQVSNEKNIFDFSLCGLEAHAGFFRLLMKGIFDAYVLWPFGKKYFWISNVR